MGTQAAQSFGLALNTDFLQNQPTKLIMKREHLSASFTIGLEGGNPLFMVDADTFSTSHQKHIIECRSGQELFTVRKQAWSMHFKYSAELPDGSGTMLFESETHAGFLSGATTNMTFRNALRNGLEEQVELQAHNFSEDQILYQGQVVAEIYKESLKMRTEYHLSMMAGVDPLLVIVLATIMDDRARTKRNRAA